MSSWPAALLLLLVISASAVDLVNKCCRDGASINLRREVGSACTKNSNVSIQKLRKAIQHTCKITANDHVFGKKYLIFSQNLTKDNIKDNMLIYEGRNISQENFCVDFATDHCHNSVEIKAVISSQDLFELEQSTRKSSVFGSAGDAWSIILAKKIGYTASVIFLILTMVSVMVIKDNRKDIGGKLVISMCASMIGLYTCLLIRTCVEDPDTYVFTDKIHEF